jgi:hypothetical protein
MAARLLLGFWLLVLGVPGIADEIALNPQHPQSYVVARGDTLWDIADRFLAKPWQWPQIWHENPQIANPHWIYPGDEITLSYVGGKPRLQVSRPSELRLSPEVRITPIEQAIPVIPMSAIRPFLSHPKVVESGTLESAPYVVGFAGEHVVAGAGDSVYVRVIEDASNPGYVVVRPGNPYRDGVTGEILGYEALYVGDAGLETTGDPARLQLTKTVRETVIGDRLLPVEREKIQMRFEPHAPSRPIEGHIIGVVDGVTQIGQLQIVVLDRGARDGIETGHVLEIFQSSRMQRDIVSGHYGQMAQMPQEKGGYLMVFKTFERVSFALVMKAVRALHVLDVVRTP